jgi:hypothetical protein
MATAEFPRDAVPPPDGVSPGAAQRLGHNLERLAARRNAHHLRNSIVRALVPGVAVSALGVLAYRFYLIDGEPWMPAAVIAASLAIGYRNGKLQQRGAFAAAVEADSALNLSDRLSSALAFSQPSAVQRVRAEEQAKDWPSRIRTALFPRLQFQTSGAASSTALVPSLVEEAATRSDSLDPKVLYPTKFDRPLQLLVGASLLLATFSFMPDNTYFLSAEQKQVTATLKAEGVKLQAIAKEVRKEEQNPQNEAAKKLSRRMEDLGRKLQRGRMTKRTALLGMGELKRDLEKAVQNDSKPGSSSDMQRMQEALKNTQFESPEAQQMQKDMQDGNIEKAAQQLEKLADKVQNGEMSQKEKEQTANDLEKMAQQLRQQGGQQGEQAAQQLEEAAKALREGNQQGQQNGQQSQQGQGQQPKQGKGQGQSQQGQGQQGQQNGQKQQGQQGGQGGQSQQGSQQGQGQGSQSGSNALRNMAKGLRQNGTQMGNSQNLRNMLDKIREAENQAGSNGGQQSGMGQKGQGQGQGQSGNGQGQGVTPGKDLMPTDPKQGVGGGAGLGRRDNIQAQQRAGGGVSNQKANRTGDKRRWGDVWSDRLPQTRQKMDRITGKMGDGGDVEQLPTQSEAKQDAVRTPYYDVYESYKKDAEDAISKESVPPAYKQPVKDYFESLKP